MKAQHTSPQFFYRNMLLALSFTITFSSCYTARVETLAQPGAVAAHKTVNFFFWGLVQNPKRVTTPNCDVLGANGMATVTVKNNFGYSLITVLTLGIWSPTRLEWECGKPCAKTGVL